MPLYDPTLMKVIALGSFFILFAIVGGLTIPTAFADHPTAEVAMAEGSGVPGCEETPEGCYLPMEVTVGEGGDVSWTNTDTTAAHTVTSGAPADSESVGALFDSGLMIADATFEWTFEAAGEYPYFCMVHPWMVGTVIVESEGMMEMEEELMVSIETTPGNAGETMDITVTITDHEGNSVEHVNYNVMATQGTETILDDTGVHDHDGVMTHTTMALPMAASDEMPVNVSVEFLGFGIDEPFTGDVGHMETAQVVPEFGTIATLILVVAIVSIIAVTARSKISLTPRI